MRRRLALALMLLLAGPAPAAGPLDAGVALGWQELDLQADGAPLETELSRAGITLWEPLHPRLWLGLEGGLLLASQSDSQIASGLDLEGQYLALAGRLRLLQGEAWFMDLGLRYDYHRLQDEFEGQELRLRWHQLRGELGGGVQLGELRLGGGAYLLALDGDEVARGPLTRTRELGLGSEAGGFARVDYWVDDTGRVGLRLDGGVEQGLRLEFSRQF